MSTITQKEGLGKLERILVVRRTPSGKKYYSNRGCIVGWRGLRVRAPGAPAQCSLWSTFSVSHHNTLSVHEPTVSAMQLKSYLPPTSLVPLGSSNGSLFRNRIERRENCAAHCAWHQLIMRTLG